MSLLSDGAIRRLIIAGGLTISPLVPGMIQPASVDLRLGRMLRVMGDPGWDHDLQKNGPFRLNPGMFVLGATRETITIGPTIAGILVGKSSLARMGLIVEDAGYFDPGWHGEGTLELGNRSSGIILLEYEAPICQMRFTLLTSPPEKLYGDPDLGSHYQNSTGPVRSYLDRGTL